MSTQPTTTTQSISESIQLIQVDGEITSFAEERLSSVFNQAFEAGARAVIWDFEKVEYLNSSGIGLLVTLLIRARKQNIGMYAFGLNEHFYQVFKLTRLNEIMQIYTSKKEAVDASQQVLGGG